MLQNESRVHDLAHICKVCRIAVFALTFLSHLPEFLHIYIEWSVFKLAQQSASFHLPEFIFTKQATFIA